MPSQLAVAKTDPGKRKDSASKQSRVIGMLRWPTGTTIAAMMQETGWRPHSVRGFLAVRSKLKLKLQSKKVNGSWTERCLSVPHAAFHRTPPLS